MGNSKDIMTLRELYKQFTFLEEKLSSEMKSSPEVKSLVSKVGNTLILYKQASEMAIKGYDSTYRYLINNPEVNISARDVVYKGRNPVQFFHEMKLWLNIKSGADPLVSWRAYSNSIDGINR